MIEHAGNVSLTNVVGRLASTGDTGNAVDGGAGSGSVSRQLLTCLTPGRRVIAYEPFEGNHRFWSTPAQNLELRKLALGSSNSFGFLRVRSVVSEDSEWGKRGMAGYSSLGFLVDEANGGPSDHPTLVVRGDDDLEGDRPIGVVKLDLQGGERQALEGMRNLLRTDVKLAWVEMLADNADIAHYLLDLGYRVLDTEYLFKGSPTDAALSYFHVTRRDVALSTGEVAWFGVPSRPWADFTGQILDFRGSLGLVQTDLLCLNPRFANLIAVGVL